MEPIRETDLGIITTAVVCKDFENNDCFLLGRIAYVTERRELCQDVYMVRTDLVYYENYNVVDPLTDAITVRKKLRVSEPKQDWSEQLVTVAEFNAFKTQMQGLIPEGLTPKQVEDWEMQMIFLMKRHEDAPWGTGTNWRVFDVSEIDIES